MSSIISMIISENFLSTIVRVGVPLMFASMSAYIASKSGLPNTATEGVMLMCALMAVLGSYWTQSAWLGLLIAVLTGIVMAILLAFMTLKLGADPFLVGIALNTFASSFTVFLLYLFTGNKGISASLASKTFPIVDIPIIEDIPIIGSIFSGQYLLTYFCFAFMIIIPFVVNKTTYGLRLQASGLNLEASQAVGIKVNIIQISAVIISGILGALGGAYMTMGYLSAFSKDMIAGRGWIGFAAEAMGGGSFLITSITTLGFSLFQALTAVLSRMDISSDLLSTVPYVGVFLGILAFSIREYQKRKKDKQ